MEENKNTQKKILIVDDDSFLLEMYTTKFKEKGFEVSQSSGSVDALNLLRNGETPDAMLMDIVVPSIDGFELLATIKKEQLSPKTKFILLSNLGQATDVKRGKELGAHGYIIKASATPSEVVERVNIILNGGEWFSKGN